MKIIVLRAQAFLFLYTASASVLVQNPGQLVEHADSVGRSDFSKFQEENDLQELYHVRAYDTGKSCAEILEELKESDCSSQFSGTSPRDIEIIDQCNYCREASFCQIFSKFISENALFIYRKMIMGLLSAFSLMIVGFFFLLNKKFSKHPYPLFAYACLLQSTYFFCHYANFMICPLDLAYRTKHTLMLLPYLFRFGIADGISNWLFNFSATGQEQYDWFRRLLIMWKVICIMATYMQITANSIIFLDLYLTLKNPFYPRKKRMPFYLMFLVFIMMGSTAGLLISIFKYGTSINLYDTDRQKDVLAIFMAFTIALTLATIIPTALSIYRLRLRGTSKKLRQKVSNRYLIYFFIYLLTIIGIIIDQTGFQVIVWFPKTFGMEVGHAEYIDLIFDMIGIPLAFIRFLEPFVFQEFKADLKRACTFIGNTLRCRRHGDDEDDPAKPKKKVKYSNEPLCAFVNSAMNIEFVYLILLGINNFMDNRSKVKGMQANQPLGTLSNQSSRVYGKKKKAQKSKIQIIQGDSKTKIKFKDINFKNIDLWAVDRQSDITSQLREDSSIAQSENSIRSFQPAQPIIVEELDDRIIGKNSIRAPSHVLPVSESPHFGDDEGLLQPQRSKKQPEEEKTMKISIQSRKLLEASPTKEPNLSILRQSTNAPKVDVDRLLNHMDQQESGVTSGSQLLKQVRSRKSSSSQMLFAHGKVTKESDGFSVLIQNEFLRQRTESSINSDRPDVRESRFQSWKRKVGSFFKKRNNLGNADFSKRPEAQTIQLRADLISHEEDKFQIIQEMDGIDPSDITASLSLEENRNMVFQAGEGAGQSGSFFFFSHDHKFLIKTLKGKEKSILLNMLDDYIDHIQKTKNKSLLARIYGVFTVKTNYFSPLDVMIMQNTVQPESKANPKMVFDLKGSTVGRFSNLPKGEQRFWKHSMGQKKCMKDMNFIEINKDFNQQLMCISKKQSEQLEWICNLDSVFLKNHGLMDYSLLLVIESKKSDPARPTLQTHLRSIGEEESSEDNSLNPQEGDVYIQTTENAGINSEESLPPVVMRTAIDRADNFSLNEVAPKGRPMSIIDEDDGRNISIYSSAHIPEPAFLSNKQMVNNSEVRNRIYSGVRDFNSFINTQQGEERRSRKTLQRTNTAGVEGKRESSILLKIPWLTATKEPRQSSRPARNSTLLPRKQEEYYEQIYHLGIIDFLQDWNLQKKVERNYKGFLKDKTVFNEISAVPPEQYQARFSDFVSKCVLKPAMINSSKKVFGDQEKFVEEMARSLK